MGWPWVCLDHTIRFQWAIGFIIASVDVLETFWLCHDFLFDSAFSYANRVNVGRSLWYLIHQSIPVVFPMLVVSHGLCLSFVFVCLPIQFMYCSVVGSSKTCLEIKLGNCFFSLLPPFLTFFPSSSSSSSSSPYLFLSFYSVSILCKWFCCH